MIPERPEVSHRRPTVALPLALVVLCGFGGMLLARHFLKPPEVPGITQQAGTRGQPGGSGDGAAASGNAAAGDLQADGANPVAGDTQAAGNTRAPGAPNGGAEIAEPKRLDLPGAGQTPTEAVDVGPARGTPGYQTEDREIGLVLERWQAALLSNDAARIAPSYSDQVQRYFLETNVTRSYVRAYLHGQESRGWRLTAYDLSNVVVDHLNPDEVDVHFMVGFAVRTDSGGRAGSARTELKLRQEDGDWKIFFERDFQS